MQVAGQIVVGRVDGVLHAQRLQDALFDLITRVVAGNLAYDLSEEDVVDVRVFGPLSWCPKENPLLRRSLDYLFSRAVVLRLSFGTNDAALHPKKVLYGDLLGVGAIRVPLREFVCFGELAFFDKL